MRYGYTIYFKRHYGNGKYETYYIPREFKTIKDARKDANIFTRSVGFKKIGKKWTDGEVWAEIYKLPKNENPQPIQFVFYDAHEGKCFHGAKSGKGFEKNRWIKSDGSLGEPYFKFKKKGRK